MLGEPKELRRLIGAAQVQGWEVRTTKHGYMLLAPDGLTKVTIHKTPGPNWLKYALRDMRRGGFIWKA